MAECSSVLLSYGGAHGVRIYVVMAQHMRSYLLSGTSLVAIPCLELDDSRSRWHER